MRGNQKGEPMPEGSVIVEGKDVDVDEVEETSEGVEETSSEEQTTESTPTETVKETEKPVAEEQVQYTDKGTVLDKNPLSAAHQQLANERRRLKQYEDVLNDPEKYIQFAKQAGVWRDQTEPTQVQPQTAKIKAEDIQTADDVVNLINSLNDQLEKTSKSYEARVQQLEQELRGISSQRQLETIARSIESDVVTVQDEYPELKSSSPYAAELEKEIVKRYHELNYNEATDSYTNAIPLTKVAEMIISPIRLASKQATDMAQTVVKHKSMGKVTTSSKTVSSDTTADESIAGLISKAYRK